MSDLLTHVDLLRVGVDLNKEPQCEGRAHPKGVDGHDGGPATHRVFFSACRCAPLSVMACSGRAAVFRQSGARCSKCGRVDRGSDLLIIEL